MTPGAGADGPPFFIVGSARSGTTLLRLMLNAHPEVAIPPESRFITELWRGRPRVDADELLNALEAHERFRLWDLPIDAVRAELAAAHARPAGPGPWRLDYVDVITAAYVAYARANSGKSRWGDKTPRYVEHIPLIASLYPSSRFIHLLRDGRNVALSYADVPFGPKTAARAAALWAKRVSAGIEGGRPLGGARYLELRYEDLVDDPESHVRVLCDFLLLDFDRGMLDYTERSRDSVMPTAGANNPHVTGPPRPRLRSWELAMPEEQVRSFEAVAGGLLEQLGYPRRFPRPGAAARARAALGRARLPVDRLTPSRPRPGDGTIS